jgi:hypothetical protein
VRVETYRCDNCDKARDKDTNHWSLVSGRTSGTDGTREIWSGPVTYNAPYGCHSGDLADACGDDCRFALMSRFLATGSFSRTAVGAK